MRRRQNLLVFALVVTGVVTLVGSCGIAIQRDLSQVTPQVVIFDDMCDLQDYFDTLSGGIVKPPRVAASMELEKDEKQRPLGGVTRFAFETDFQLRHLRRVLGANWRKLPEEAAKAKRIDIEVRWAEKAGVRRVVTTEDAAMMIGDDRHDLPYHVCLSELLFGEPLYRTRRELVLGVPAVLPPTPADAGAPADAAALH